MILGCGKLIFRAQVCASRYLSPLVGFSEIIHVPRQPAARFGNISLLPRHPHVRRKTWPRRRRTRKIQNRARKMPMERSPMFPRSRSVPPRARQRAIALPSIYPPKYRAYYPMQKLLHMVYWTLCRWLLALRYRVRVSGLDKLQSLEGPTLVMPNHPGYIDPAIVLAHVRLKQPLRPIVYEDTYRFPLFY